MADPFELWRLAWTNAVSRFADFIPGAAISGREAAPPDLSTLPVFGRVQLELPTMLLLEERDRAAARTTTLIVAPYAVHEASIADFAEGHSLAQALAEGGSGSLALTYWKSATADMRDYGIDAYLGDLNVAVDDFGGRVSLVGLCQGGWLAAAYAARFPGKVAKLALAGAPIDLGAAESDITRALASVSPWMIANMVALGGGRISGSLPFALASDHPSPEFTAEAALQCAGEPAMMARFDAWDLRMMVPAVTEVCLPQPAHSQVHGLVCSCHALPLPQPGHRKPCGQRAVNRYSTQAASFGKRTTPSCR